jgi:hypothetical protein
MKMDRVTAKDFPPCAYAPPRRSAFRQISLTRTQAVLRSADGITDAIIAVSNGMSRAGATLVAGADRLIASAEKVADAIIRVIDAAQRRPNQRS